MLSLVSYVKADKRMFNGLDYKGIEFTVSKKDFDKIEKIIIIIIVLMCFVIKIIWFILFMNLMKNLKIVWIY